MRGRNHAICGTSAWLSIAPFLPDSSPTMVFSGAVLCAGAALLPDSDHPSASIAHSLPPFSAPICKVIHDVSGGHRHGTHSILGVALATFLTWLAMFPTATVFGREVSVGSGLIAIVMTAFAVKGLELNSGMGKRGSATRAVLRSTLGPWIIAVSTAGLITWVNDYRWTWLPWCMAIGCIVHILGDMLTKGGAPILWPCKPKGFGGFFPMSNGWFAIPILGRTAQPGDTIFSIETREPLFMLFVNIYTVAVFAVAAYWSLTGDMADVIGMLRGLVAQG